MDSITNFFFKGYGKLSNPPEAFPPLPPRDRRPLLIIVTVSAIVLLTLTLGLLLTALIHESVTEPPESLLRSNLTSTILFVCRSTDHPDSCFESISSVNKSAKPGEPGPIFRLSLTVCSQELDKVSGYVVELARSGPSYDAGSRAAIEDCQGQIEDAASKVADSARRIGVAAGIPSDDEIADVTTWLSAAMTDGETCVDGLEEVGSTPGADRVKEKMRKAKEYLSNSLAIAVNMNKIVEEFGLD